MDETEERQEYVHLVNDKPLAGSQAVPDSPLATTIDSKVRDVIFESADGTETKVNSSHVASFTETTEDEIRSIIAMLN